MTRVSFSVPVASDAEAVRRRIDEAARKPNDFVRMFTNDRSITAVVHTREVGWNLKVTGPQFSALGSAELFEHTAGTIISIDLDITPRGIFVLASPAIGLATNKIRSEATQTLQAEFGVPRPN